MGRLDPRGSVLVRGSVTRLRLRNKEGLVGKTVKRASAKDCPRLLLAVRLDHLVQANRGDRKDELAHSGELGKEDSDDQHAQHPGQPEQHN